VLVSSKIAVTVLAVVVALAIAAFVSTEADISTITAVLAAFTMSTVVRQAKKNVPTKLVGPGIAEQCYLLCKAIQVWSIITRQAEGPSLLVGRLEQPVIDRFATAVEATAAVPSAWKGLAPRSHQSCKVSVVQVFDSQAIDTRVSLKAQCCPELGSPDTSCSLVPGRKEPTSVVARTVTKLLDLAYMG